MHGYKEESWIQLLYTDEHLYEYKFEYEEEDTYELPEHHVIISRFEGST